MALGEHLISLSYLKRKKLIIIGYLAWPCIEHSGDVAEK